MSKPKKRSSKLFLDVLDGNPASLNNEPLSVAAYVHTDAFAHNSKPTASNHARLLENRASDAHRKHVTDKKAEDIAGQKYIGKLLMNWASIYPDELKYEIADLAHWNNLRLKLSSSAIRRCTQQAQDKDKKSEQQSSSLFRIGTVDGNDKHPKCWSLDELQQTVLNVAPERLSPYDRLRVARYARVLSNTNASACFERRDMSNRVCRVECEYVEGTDGEKGWFHQLVQLTSPTKKDSKDSKEDDMNRGVCRPTRLYVEELMALCLSSSTRWTSELESKIRLLVFDLWASWLDQRLYRPTLKQLNEVERWEARDALTQYQAVLKEQLKTWDREELCVRLQELVHDSDIYNTEKETKSQHLEDHLSMLSTLTKNVWVLVTSNLVYDVQREQVAQMVASFSNYKPSAMQLEVLTLALNVIIMLVLLFIGDGAMAAFIVQIVRLAWYAVAPVMDLLSHNGRSAIPVNEYWTLLAKMALPVLAFLMVPEQARTFLLSYLPADEANKILMTQDPSTWSIHAAYDFLFSYLPKPVAAALKSVPLKVTGTVFNKLVDSVTGNLMAPAAEPVVAAS